MIQRRMKGQGIAYSSALVPHPQTEGISMRSLIVAGSLLLALSSSVTAAQIYKWVDAEGTTHFGAQPPAGQTAETLSRVAAPPKPSAQPAIGEQAEDPDAQQRDIERKVKQQVATQEAERKRYCETLRTNLAQLENNPRVRVEDNGEVRRVTEDERQERITETRLKIGENCQ